MSIENRGVRYDYQSGRTRTDDMADTTAKSKCEHRRTRLIAKDNEAQYVECVDCGEILETGEIKAAPASASPQKNVAGSPPGGFDESLSDA